MNPATKIVRSCELVDNVWMQVEELSNALSALTVSAIENSEFENLQKAGSPVSAHQRSGSGWTTSAYGISFPLMEKKRRKATPTAWINYQLSVFGAGIPPLDNAGQQSTGPLMHVSFWNLGTDFDDPGLYVEFPPAWDDWEIKDDRLLFWKSENGGPFPQWTFSVSLLSLNNEDALRECVIKPVRALLGGTQTSAALPDDLPGLVFYRSEDQGESGWGLKAIRCNAA
jgi:hypothetical protein